jgi:hypothetical protein
MNQRKLVSLVLSSFLLTTTTYATTSLKGEVLSLTPASHNWSGFYAGFNLGAVNHTMDITDVNAATFHATIEQVSNPKGTGGLQIGYRQQLTLNTVSGVYGLELSANFANAQFKKEYGSPFALYQLYSKNELKTVVLLEAIGGIAADKTFLFLGAGLAWVNISGSTTSLDGAPFFNSFSVEKKQLGTVLSGGLEYAFTNQISARFKMDVITPNTYSTTDDTGTAIEPGNSYQIANKIIQGTVAINYQFA